MLPPFRPISELESVALSLLPPGICEHVANHSRFGFRVVATPFRTGVPWNNTSPRIHPPQKDKISPWIKFVFLKHCVLRSYFFFFFFDQFLGVYVTIFGGIAFSAGVLVTEDVIITVGRELPLRLSSPLEFFKCVFPSIDTISSEGSHMEGQGLIWIRSLQVQQPSDVFIWWTSLSLR